MHNMQSDREELHFPALQAQYMLLKMCPDELDLSLHCVWIHSERHNENI
jgi:hypothetical protein